MRTFKFLDPNGATVFTGSSWPRPTGDGPGSWVEAPSVRPCHSGIHACEVGDLAYWIGAELWEIELDGEIERSHHKVVAPRGRLVRRIDAWADEVAAQLPRWCAWRTRDHAVEVLAGVGLDPWAERFVAANTLDQVTRVATEAIDALGDISVGGSAAALAGDAAELVDWLAIGAFIAACAAGHSARRDIGTEADYARAFAAERRTQSAWIAAELQLA
jgi:hypothetical protein